MSDTVPLSSLRATDGIAEPAQQAPADSRVDVVVLSTDAALRSAVRDASDDLYRVWLADTAEGSVDLLVSGRCAILLADLDRMRGDVESLFDRLGEQFPDLVLLAAGSRDEEAAVGPLLSSGRIYRFLHKPVSPARATQFLGAAVRRHLELRELQTTMLTTVKLMVARPRWKLAAVSVAATAAIIAVSVFFQPAAGPVADLRGPTQLAGVDREQSLRDALDQADDLFRRGQYTLPAGGSALDLYRAVLKQNPRDTRATVGVQRIVDALLAQTELAVRSRAADRAVSSLNDLRRIRSTHPRLPALEAQVAALMLVRAADSGVASPAPQTSAKPAVDPVSALLGRAQQRMDSDALLEPEHDSARDYLRQARLLRADDSAVQIAATDLGNRLLDRARAFLSQPDLDSAAHWLAAAQQTDAEFELALPGLDSLHDELVTAQRTARRMEVDRLLGLATVRRSEGLLTVPGGDSARDYLVQARSSLQEGDTAPAGLAAESWELAMSLYRDAQQLFAAGQLEAAQARLREAQDIGVTLPQADSLLQAIGQQRERQIEAAQPGIATH